MSNVNENKKPFLNASEFAKRIGVNRVTIIRWHRSGFLPAHHVVPGSYMYTEEQVQKYLNGEYTLEKTTHKE